MTFTYFIGLILAVMVLNFCVWAMLDGILGLFYRPVGDRYLKVVVKRMTD